MEQARILLAIVLSFLLFFAYEMFFVKREPVKQTEQTTETGQAPEVVPEVAKETPYQPEMSAKEVSAETPIAEAKPSTDRPPRSVYVETPFYRVRISEKGAVFGSFELIHYRETVEPDSPPKQLISGEIGGGTVQTRMLRNGIPGMETAYYSGPAMEEPIRITDNPETVSFTWRSPQGFVVEKAYRFSPESYLIGLTVTIKNGSGASLADSLTVSLVKQFEEDKRAIGFRGPSVLMDGRVEQVKIQKIEEKDLLSGKFSWMALQSRYFLQAFIVEEPVDSSVRLSQQGTQVVKSRFNHPETTIKPGTQRAFEYKLFLGPKSLGVLNDTGFDLAKVIDFGWFHIIAKPCLWIMNFIYGFIPNYGIAIIILTLITKVLLWPLGTKSYKSMSQMKKIQPLMTELREKYKNDKKRMNQEMMNLYRTYKINPMGGCLPMAAQIPVFIALYRMLYEAIELRHAPFFGWINDLSAPDRLFRFNVSIPLMEPPYGIPVLTLVMGASMLIQQKMTPTPGDPSQAKMMMLMPIIFTFIFINFPSGLVLYWLTNQIVSIGQQQFTQRKYM